MGIAPEVLGVRGERIKWEWGVWPRKADTEPTPSVLPGEWKGRAGDMDSVWGVEWVRYLRSWESGVKRSGGGGVF